MTMYYSEPERETDAHALPDVEVFEIWTDGKPSPILVDEDGATLPPGWYYWYCLPGCLPDSEPYGPYDSEEEALAEARDA